MKKFAITWLHAAIITAASFFLGKAVGIPPELIIAIYALFVAIEAGRD